MMRKYLGIALALLMIVFTSVTFAATDKYNDGAWKIDSNGDLLPITTNTYDIGSASLYPAQIFLGGVGKSSWGSVVSPWEDVGTTTDLTSAPTYFVLTHATGDLYALGFTVGTGDISFANGQKIDGDTAETIKLIEASDTLTFGFTGSDVTLDTSDGGFIFLMTQADGTVSFKTNNDSDDYLVIETVSNVPTIVTAGTSNLVIAPDGGTTTVTGALTASGLVTSAGLTTSSTITLHNSETITNETNGTITLSGATNQIVDILDAGTSDSDATLQLTCDAAGDNGDTWQIQADGGTQDLLIRNNTSGSQATWVQIADTTGLITTSGDLTVTGTTPKVIIGDAGAEDNALVFDGQSTKDFYVATYATDDTFMIGYGSTIGTDARITINDDANNTTITLGDGAAYDTEVIFNGSATDYYMAVDDTDASFIIGEGSTVATTPALAITTTTLALTTYGDLTMTGTTPLLTIGDGGNEDAGITFNGASTADYYISYDHTGGQASTCLTMGVGSAVGTTPVLSIDASSNLILADKEYITNASDVIGIWGDDNNTTVKIVGFEDKTSALQLIADQDDDATDGWQILAADSATGILTIGNDSSAAGTFIAKATIDSTGAMTVQGSEATAGSIAIWSDNGDEAADKFTMSMSAADALTMTTGTTEAVSIATTGTSTLAAATVTGTLTANGAIVAGYEMVTCSSADPGVGTASLTKLFTDITSDATGSLADQVSLAAGAAGQMKVLQLAVDGETTGTSIEANFFGATAHALMEDVGDVLILISDGTEWHIILNTGCTLS